jgi:hypothetical protein
MRPDNMFLTSNAAQPLLYCLDKQKMMRNEVVAACFNILPQ